VTTQAGTDVEERAAETEATPVSWVGEETIPEQGATDKLGRGIDETVVVVVATPK